MQDFFSFRTGVGRRVQYGFHYEDLFGKMAVVVWETMYYGGSDLGLEGGTSKTGLSNFQTNSILYSKPFSPKGGPNPKFSCTTGFRV